MKLFIFTMIDNDNERNNDEYSSFISSVTIYYEHMNEKYNEYLTGYASLLCILLFIGWLWWIIFRLVYMFM